MEFHFLLVKQKKVAFQKPVKTFLYLYARGDLSARSFVFVKEQPKEAIRGYLKDVLYWKSPESIVTSTAPRQVIVYYDWLS